ncbi:MAG: SRPBCC domain-containing protein [Flavobacteriaceae bacterium]|nr:SRPBCC domain-containing protein [Flavobacteriaceae bacterium]
MNSIYHDLKINASAKEVFDAITQPHHLNNWWTLRCTGVPEKGAEYNFYFAPEYNWYGEVVECKPNQSFHIKMTSADEDWDPTTFGFDLEESSEGTGIKFWHKDWPECNHHYRKSSYCWAILLSYLKNYLENGTVVPFEQRE